MKDLSSNNVFGNDSIKGSNNGVGSMERRNGSSVVKWLLERNREQSKVFMADYDARLQYLASHTTQVIALKCMDGRLNLAFITNTPLGVINPHRNVGGKFDLGWPFFGSILQRQVEEASKQGRKTIVLTTYHFSKGDKHRCCAGFNYDTEAAMASATNVKKEVEQVFGSHAGVYPVVMGIETDLDALVVHGEKGEVLDIGQEEKLTEAELIARIRTMFPDMPDIMLADFLPLLLGNLKHVAKVRRAMKSPIALDHTEQVLAFGRGFDWLHEPNKALIVGPYDIDLATPVGIAASILLANIERSRIPVEQGVVLLVSSVYRGEAGPDKLRAVLKSKMLHNFALDVIRAKHPKLMDHLTTLVGIVNPDTRQFIQID